MKEGEIVINIESCMDNMNQEAECPDVGDDKAGDLHSFKVCGKPVSVDALANGEGLVKPQRDGGGVSPDSGEKVGKERRMSMSAKKPPRPPRGLSLDAADQKLIKEISELLLIKRARMKALKKTKAAAKGMSASSSSSGNFIAMLFTILFCLAIIFQGCHPWGIFARNSSSKSARAAEGDIVALHDNQSSSINSAYLAKVRSPNLRSNNKPADGETIR